MPSDLSYSSCKFDRPFFRSRTPNRCLPFDPIEAQHLGIVTSSGPHVHYKRVVPCSIYGLGSSPTIEQCLDVSLISTSYVSVGMGCMEGICLWHQALPWMSSPIFWRTVYRIDNRCNSRWPMPVVSMQNPLNILVKQRDRGPRGGH